MLKTGCTLLAFAVAASAFADTSMVELAKRSKRKTSTTRVITNATVGKGEGRVSTGSQPAASAPTVPQTTTAAPAKQQQTARTDTAPLPSVYEQGPQKNSSLPTSSAKNVEPSSSAKSSDPTVTAHSTTPQSTVKVTQPTANTVKNTTPSTTARFVPSGN